MVNKVLFLMERYCDADPKCGPTIGESTLVGAIQSTGLVGETKRFYYDTLCQQLGREKMAEVLLQDCEIFHPDLIIYTPFRGPLAQFNPPNGVLSIIRNRGIKVYTHLWDTVTSDEYIKSQLLFSDYTGIGDSAVLSRFGDDPRIIQSYSSADPKYFYDKKLLRDIDISFIGAVDPAGIKWPQRIQAINYLRGNGVNIVVAGGQRQSRLSWEEFSNFLSRSKMTVNFSRNPYDGTSQLKARVFEALSCATMLLEENGTETKRLFEPDRDFIMFDGEQDLLEKVRYYLEYTSERETIARSGYGLVVNIYNPRNLWGYIFERMGFQIPEQLKGDRNFQLHEERIEAYGRKEAGGVETAGT